MSEDREGRALGVDRQRQDCEALAERLGWPVVGVYVDNDRSAWSGKSRPEYRRLLADVEAGTVDAVLVWSLDRLHRRPAELEDFVTLADSRGVALANVAGEVDLATPAGRLHARIMGSVAAHEVEQKGARTARAHLQAAQQGRWRGGTRPFGFGPDGVTIDRVEAREVRRMTQRLLAGESLGSLVRDLNTRGITTTTGKPWSYTAVRQLLSRPRNAGLSEYRGEVVGVGSWRPLVTEESWRAVVALLADPGRRKSLSNRPRWLLAGLARCGVCGGTMRSATAHSNRRTGTHRNVYRCATAGGGHVARTAVPVDEYVAAVAVERLSRADARDLLTTGDDAPDAGELREESLALRSRLESLALDFADGDLTPAQLRAATERLRERLATVEAQQASTSSAPVLADLVQAEDVRAVWDGLPLSRRRAVVDLLMTVTVLPVGRSGNAFDPDAVQITWRQP